MVLPLHCICLIVLDCPLFLQWPASLTVQAYESQFILSQHQAPSDLPQLSALPLFIFIVIDLQLAHLV